MITKVKFQDGKIEHIDISKKDFIPNGMFREFEKLIAKDGEEKVELLHSFSAYETRKPYMSKERVEVLYSRSAYGSDKPHMSKEQTEAFKYPCIYTVPESGIPNLMYSSTNTNGHFGIPKVIWSNGAASTPVIDEKGDYGLAQFSYAIIDEPKNLPFIKKAMLTANFIKLMDYADGISNLHRYNRKAISVFSKDFWKDFI